MRHSVKTYPDRKGVEQEWHLLEQRAPNGRLAASTFCFKPNEERRLKAFMIRSQRADVRNLIETEGKE